MTGLIAKLINEQFMPGVKWVLKSNIHSHVIEKHVVECPDATRLLAQLREMEDRSGGSQPDIHIQT